MPDPARHGGERRITRACLGIVLGLIVVALGLEFGVRFLVFSDTRIARRLGAKFRHAQNFADPAGEDDYWKLNYLFIEPGKRRPANHPDPRIGWAGETLTEGTYAPVSMPDLAGRTPVLLYGDSFAACTTAQRDCWQGILARSPLADRYCLVNYGVGGYGMDQIYLLVRASIDRWRDLKPIVVVSVLIDDDFNRSVLHFRCWPRPRSSVEDGQIVCEGPPTLDPAAYVESNPVSFSSYFLRLLAFGPIRIPERLRTALRPDTARLEEKQELALATLEAIRSELDSRGIRWFLLAFHGKQYLRGEPKAVWAEPLVREFAAAHGIPWISSEPYLLAAAGGDVARMEQLFGHAPGTVNHYTRVGNLVVFRALASGIQGTFDPPDTAGLAELVARAEPDDLERVADVVLFERGAKVRTRGKSGFARVAKVPYGPFDRRSREPYMILCPGEQGPTEARFFLDAGRLRFRGRAVSVHDPRAHDLDKTGAPLTLTARVDGRLVLHERVPELPDGLDLDVDLDGASIFELVAERGGGEPGATWVHVERARLESAR